MRIIRFIGANNQPIVGALTNENQIFPLKYSDFMELVQDAEEEQKTVLEFVQHLVREGQALTSSLEELHLLTPVVAPEVWAAGVTYMKSRQARNYETKGGLEDNSETFYDKVYDAERPEIFFKSTAARTVAPNDVLCIRSDSKWQVPEPEVGVVINQAGKILGYTIGNDMSSRDIEGENPLYLPQAKIWKNSCAIGPAIILAEAVEDPYNFEITLSIYRGGKKVVEESANTSQLKRKFDELVSFLVRDNIVFDGTILLTGTCAVPQNEFTLQDGDRIEIEVSNIGVLINPVKQLVAAAQSENG